jgi:hypothetical protein
MAIMVGVSALHRVPESFAAWKLSQLCIAAGSGLVAARGAVPNWASVVVGNLLVLTGLGLITEGFARFYHLVRLIPVWVDLAVLLLAGTLLTVWVETSVNARIVVAGVVAAFYFLRTALEPLASGEGRRSAAQRALTALHLSAAVLFLGRAGWAASVPRYTVLWREGWSALAPGFVFLAVNAISMYIALFLTFERSENQLRSALSEVKTLSGLLPICAHCHKIRDDHGYWDQLERFISNHSAAQFTHGICPECLARYFPDGYEAKG